MPKAQSSPASGGLNRRIIMLALPALGSLLAEPLYTATDTAIIGHLGKIPLGGLAVATTVLDTIAWSLGGFLTMATTTEVSFRQGGDRSAGAGSIATTAYAMAAVLGTVSAGALGLWGQQLAGLMGGGAGVTGAAGTYLAISALGVPALFISLAGTGHAQGRSDVVAPLLILVISNAINVAAEVALVYGAGMGIAGSALGTVVAQFVAGGLFVTYSARFIGKDGFHVRWDAVGTLLKAGRRITVRTAALLAVMTTATALAARLGNTALDAHQITLQIWMILALVLDALALPAQILTSAALGRGERGEAARIGKAVLAVGIATGGVFGSVVLAAAGLIPSTFSTAPDVRRVASETLVVCALAQPAAAVAFVTDGLLLGAGDYPAIQNMMVASVAAFIPLAATTLAWPKVGIVGVWAALACWVAARALLGGLRWRKILTGSPGVEGTGWPKR